MSRQSEFSAHWILDKISLDVGKKKSKRKAILRKSDKGYYTLSSPEVKIYKGKNNGTVGKLEDRRVEICVSFLKWNLESRKDTDLLPTLSGWSSTRLDWAVGPDTASGVKQLTQGSCAQ